MFDMRIREEADGERRMIGSGREDEPDLRDDEVMDSPADGAGTTWFLLPGLAPACPARLRLRSRKVSALLRTCEKSCSIVRLDVGVVTVWKLSSPLA